MFFNLALTFYLQAYFGNGRISVESCLYEGTSITIEFDQMEKYDEECNDCR